MNYKKYIINKQTGKLQKIKDYNDLELEEIILPEIQKIYKKHGYNNLNHNILRRENRKLHCLLIIYMNRPGELNKQIEKFIYNCKFELDAFDSDDE